MMQLRPIRNAWPVRSVLMGAVLASMVMGSALGAPSVWRDYASGYAIGGYDPVAYFTQNAPTLGHEGIEHHWGGASWRFVNTGNRDAFAKHPSVYAPQFAGYDVISLSKGLTVQGSPSVWALYKQRTYLFASKASLRAWRRNRDKIIKAAHIKWAVLGKNLPGTSEK